MFANLSYGTREDDASPKPSRLLVTAREPHSAASEAYRSLRTNLLYEQMDSPPRVIVLTSPEEGEGASVTCANLGVVLAQADRRTLIVDCNFRAPFMHTMFGLENGPGVVSVLMQERNIEEVWHETLPCLKVLTAGPASHEPTELLSSESLAELLRHTRGDFDYVLIDTPPVGAVPDPAIVAAHSDGVLLVVDAQHTARDAVRESVRILGALKARVIGTVLNNIKSSGAR